MLKEMIVEKSRKHSEILYPLGAFAASAVMAFSSSGMAAAPLICAFSGAFSPLSSVAFSLGGIITYLTSESVTENAFMMIAFVLVSIGKWFIRDDDTPKNAAFITFVSMAFGGLVSGFLISRSPIQSLINISLSLLSALAAYFIRTACEALCNKHSLYADKRTLTALGAAFMLIVTLLSGLSFSVINAGDVLGCVVILCASRFFGCYGGVICAVITSAGLLAGQTELGLQTVFFGAAGLAAGFCRSYSRITVTAVFTAVNLSGQLAVGMDEMSFFIQADTVIGGALFLLLPEKFIVSCGRFCTGTVAESTDFAGKEMEFAAGALCDIRENITSVMNALQARKIPYSMSADVCEQICGKCRNKLDCWEKNYERTNTLFQKLELKRLSDINTVSAGFECVKRREVLEGFERARREEAFSKILFARINENRKLLFSQMEASEEIIKSLAGKMNVNISKSMTASLCRLLDKSEIDYSAAAAYYNNSGKLIIEIYIPSRSEKEIPHGMCKTLSRELGVTLEYSGPFRCGKETRLRYNQQTRYSLSYISKQMSARHNEPSGDKCGFFTDGLGKAYIFISDGMGSGSQAALDSEISSRLFKRLIRSGMGCEGAVKLINSVMLTKPSDESFATLDIAEIDLDTGDMTIYKSGAAATLIRYSDAVVMYSLSSNPIGIIPDPVTSKKDCKLKRGDIVVMMSDGVPEAAYPYIKEQFSMDINREKLADNICGYSHKIMSGVMPDDVTVTLSELIEN